MVVAFSAGTGESCLYSCEEKVIPPLSEIPGSNSNPSNELKLRMQGSKRNLRGKKT